MLSASFLEASDADDVDHPAFSVFGAELRPFVSFHAIGGLLLATRVGTLLVDDVYHARLGMDCAKLTLEASCGREYRPRSTAFVSALLADQVHHALNTMCKAKPGAFITFQSERRPPNASLLSARLIADIDHPGFGVLRAELPLIATFYSVAGSRAASTARTPLSYYFDRSFWGVLCAEVPFLTSFHLHSPTRSSRAFLLDAYLFDLEGHHALPLVVDTKFPLSTARNTIRCLSDAFHERAEALAHVHQTFHGVHGTEDS